MALVSLLSVSCISYKTNTEIKVESYQESVKVYKKDPGAAGGYAAEEIALLVYRISKVQKSVFDASGTIISTLELLSAVGFSIIIYIGLMSLKRVQTLPIYR